MAMPDTPLSGESKRAGFEELGFHDPETLTYLERNFSSVEALQEKILALYRRGAPNPIQAIKKHPGLSSLDIDRVFDKLEANNITNAGEAVQKYPQLADLDIEAAISNWRRAGVHNPAKSISTHPSMAGRNPTVVINVLLGAGLKHPGDAISSYPPLSCLSPERVAERVSIAPHFNRTQEPNFDSVAFLEKNPQLFGYNIHRVLFYLRIASHFSLESKQSVALLKKNPYLILHILSRTIPASNANLLQEAHAISKIKKSEKATVIQETKKALPESIELLKEQVLKEFDKERNNHAHLCLSLAHSLVNLEKSKNQKKESDDEAETTKEE